MTRRARFGCLAGVALLGGCGPQEEATVRAGLSVVETLGAGDTAGFARADRVRPFIFPADHGAHPDFRNEWWYFTGTLEGGGERFGFQLTFFRTAVAADTPGAASAWATRQVWMAHFALTDPARGRFHAFDRFARGAVGLAGATSEPYRVWTADWELAAVDSGSVFPLRIRAADGDVALDLVLEPRRGPVLQGDRGLDAKGAEPGNASYYYSYPRLAARGRVSIDAVPRDVSGTVWLDREWSTSALGQGVEGWDWFALRLDDGTDLMYYRLRRADGGTDPYSDGIVIAPDGSTRSLAAGDVTLTPTRSWTSARGATYPVAWRLDVAALGYTLTLEPWLEGQELDVAFRYWEGAVDVRGSGPDGELAGVGYVELTGYDALPTRGMKGARATPRADPR